MATAPTGSGLPPFVGDEREEPERGPPTTPSPEQPTAVVRPQKPAVGPSAGQDEVTRGLSAQAGDPAVPGPPRWNLSSAGASAPTAPQEELPVLPPGSELNGRYVVERVLGAGGMGIVYKVRDSIYPDREVALKTLKCSSGGEMAVGLFMAEFRTMTKLYHPGVARVFDFEPLHGSPDFLTTLEYVEGKSIYEATQGADWSQIVPLTVQLCRALAYMHSRQVIHFDLKPANILVQSSGQTKILDFGIAGSAPKMAGRGVMGTPGYIAPELLLNGPAIDHRSDLYSLGVILFRLLARRNLFPGASADNLNALHCFSEPDFEPLREVAPEWLVDVVRRLCAKNPDQRFATANAVIEAINERGGQHYELETDETRDSYIGSAQLVGRARELEQVVEFTRTCLEGRRPDVPFLLVSGRSGMGKTRLMREVKYQCQLQRAPFIEVNCYQAAASELGPIAEALDHLVRLARGLPRPPPSLEHILPVWRRHIGGDGQDGAERSRRPSAGGTLDRQAEFELISEFFADVALLQPYALYVNDLQWAQSGAIDILCSLVLRMVQQRQMRAAESRLAVLGSCRTDEVESRPIESLLRLIRQREGPEPISLAPLGAAQVQASLASMLAIKELPVALIDSVVRATRGNPLFVEEVTRLLVERRIIRVEKGRWALADDFQAFEIPPIDQVILDRTLRLTVQERQVLELLSVCARPVRLDLIQKMTGLGPEALHQCLQQLTRRRMARSSREQNPLVETQHDKVRSTVYAAIPADERGRLHETVAEAYEKVFAEDLTPHLATLAYHFGRSARDALAVRYNVLAAEQARGKFEYELAVQCLQVALDRLSAESRAGSDRRAELTELQGDCLYRAGALSRATDTFEELLQSEKEPARRARLLQRLGDVARERGDVATAADYLWQGLTALGWKRPKTRGGLMLLAARQLVVHLLHRLTLTFTRRPRSPEQSARTHQLAQLLLTLMRTQFNTDPVEITIGAYGACNLLERDAGAEPALLSEAYLYVGMMYLALGMNGSARSFLDRGAEVGRRAGLEQALTQADAYRSMIDYFEGDWDNSIRVGQRCARQFSKYGDLMNLGGVSASNFNPLWFRGQLQEAWRNNRAIEDLQQRTGQLIYGHFSTTQLLTLRMMIENTDLQAEVTALEERLTQQRLWFLLGDVYYRMADLHLQRGDYTRALDYGRKLTADIIGKANFANGWFMVGIPVYARAWIEQLRAQRASGGGEQRAALRQARRWTRKALTVAKRLPPYRAIAYLALGELRWLLGARRTAREAFHRAFDAARSIDARLWLAQAYFSAGRCFREDPKTHLEGTVLLNEALAHFVGIGAQLWVDRVRRELGHEGRPPPSPVPLASVLASPRPGPPTSPRPTQ